MSAPKWQSIPQKAEAEQSAQQERNSENDVTKTMTAESLRRSVSSVNK